MSAAPLPPGLHAESTTTEHAVHAPETADAPPAPRVVDEHTDMTTLTDQEIMRLMEGMGQEDVQSKVSTLSPLSYLALGAHVARSCS